MTLDLLVEQLEDIQSGEFYQKQIDVLYGLIKRHHHTSLSVLIDPNAHGKERLAVLDAQDKLVLQPLKKIHHTFEYELALIQIPLQASYGQQWIERLLALAILENQQDQFRQPCARSVGLWLFDMPITPSLKHTLYLMGQAIDPATRKKRYVRYWDARVLAVLNHVWSVVQKDAIHRLGVESLYFVNWHGELQQAGFAKMTDKEALAQAELDLRKQPPFWFDDEQWAVLKQVDWINMLVRQIRITQPIDDSVYHSLITHAKQVGLQKMTKPHAIQRIAQMLSLS